MGTSIELTLGNVSLDYSKNHMGNDYGFLFQDGDEDRRKSEQINYEYYEENPDETGVVEMEAGFVRPLSRVLPRLQLLGYTLESARTEYQAVVDSMAEMDDNQSGGTLIFEDFCALACRHPLSSLNSCYVDYDTPERDKTARGRFAAEVGEFERIPWNGNSESYWSESSFISAKICILSATSMLQVFGLNPANADTEVVWQFGPLVNAGWASRDSFHAGARRIQKILIATEGSSDARIIKRALDLFHFDISDFFQFIDVNERHPFWGTGNLVNFAEGLLRIDVQNKLLFVLDNDAEGVDAFRKLGKLKLPSNMRSMLLPDLDEFRNFPARGPEGITQCDINGRAAAIECYLDLRLPGHSPAKVIWSNYKKDIDAWQGALEHKDLYMKYFLERSTELIFDGSYNTSKLAKLLGAIVTEASYLSVWT